MVVITAEHAGHTDKEGATTEYTEHTEKEGLFFRVFRVFRVFRGFMVLWFYGFVFGGNSGTVP